MTPLPTGFFGTEFETSNGETFHLVEFVSPNLLKSWKADIQEAILGAVNVKRVDVDELKRIEVWQKLSDKIKEEVEAAKKAVAETVKNRMENARKSRRQRYPNIPREITCTKCNEAIKIVPGTIAKRLEKKDLTIEQYIKDFQCQKCNPTPRGRAANPENASMPKKLTCFKCKQEKGTTPAQFTKQLKKSGLAKDEFLKTYECKSCRKNSKLPKIKETKEAKEKGKKKGKKKA